MVWHSQCTGLCTGIFIMYYLVAFVTKSMRVKTTAKLTRNIGGVYDFHTRQGITLIIDLVYMLTSN